MMPNCIGICLEVASEVGKLCQCSGRAVLAKGLSDRGARLLAIALDVFN